MSLTLVPPVTANPPILEELLLPDFKADLRIDGTSEDALLVLMLAAARRYFEGRDGMLGRAFLTSTWDWSLDMWPPTGQLFLVPLSPLQSVQSISVRDAAGGVTTLDPTTYQVDTRSEPGRIAPKAGTWWPIPPWPTPTMLGVLAAITIRFTAGYGTRAIDIPEPLRMALLATAGEFYTNRDTGALTVPPWVDRLVASYRI